jgi:ABC-type dipeptide/oligopeptide/nickel transport system permease subunit
MSLHIIFGLLSGIFIFFLFPNLNFVAIIVLSILGSILPDLDHFLFLFVYGRHTKYARMLRGYLIKLDYKNFSIFAKKNHKSNYFILSHNILSPIIFLLLTVFCVFFLQAYYWGAFWIGCFSHFLFDILEDMLHNGKLNPNWFFRFAKPD